VRLFRRDAARYPNRRVHADMTTLEPPAVLEAALDHHMVEDLTEYAERLQRYAWWGAAQLWRDGRRAGAWEIAVRPTWRFIRTYLVQGGVLEGVHGLVMCALQAHAAFLKYSTLWYWRLDEARGRRPALPEFDDDPATWAWPASSSEVALRGCG
jgi:(heptosyl)LPS beta-1,4-glucosyltransferase